MSERSEADAITVVYGKTGDQFNLLNNDSDVYQDGEVAKAKCRMLTELVNADQPRYCEVPHASDILEGQGLQRDKIQVQDWKDTVHGFINSHDEDGT